jgi:hypothetical protein
MRVCESCRGNCGCGCDTYLIDNQGLKESSVHLPNCDSEKNNPDFINRK